MSDDAAIRDLLLTTRRIAVVGASNRPGRPSNGVFAFLLARGYDAVPVNPTCAGHEIHGRVVVRNLDEARPLDEAGDNPAFLVRHGGFWSFLGPVSSRTPRFLTGSSCAPESGAAGGSFQAAPA